MTAPQPIQLRTLGPVGLTRSDGTEITAVLTQPKRLALLVYLAVANRGALCRRDTVLGVFWPEFDQERARAALRKALHFLRRELGEGVITARGDEEIGVDAHRLTSDANEFDAAFRAGQWDQALATYGGDFLAGFHLSDIPAFEQWCEESRAILRRDAVRAAERSTEEATAGGDPKAAVEAATVWTRLAPYDETAARALISTLHATGDRAGALQAFEALGRRLNDLDLEPSPDTRALATSIREPSPSAASPGPAQLVSRANSARRALVGVGAAGVAIVGIVTLANVPRIAADPATVAVTEFANLTGDPALDPIGAVYQRAVADGLTLVRLISLWRAPIAAQRGAKDRAVQLLDQAFREGTWFQPNAPVDGGFWHTDPDFEPLRGYPPYERLIAPKD